MTAQSPSPARTVILAAIDGVERTDDVLRSALLHARTLPGAELHLLHVIEPLPDPVNGNVTVATQLLEAARALMDETTESARQSFSGRICSHVATGRPWREIVQLAMNLQADLIVVGSHNKRGLERWLLGSVSEQVVRKASCEVLVARPKGGTGIPEIEPPCPECVALQASSGGQQLWCTRHDHRHAHPRGHVHYEQTPSFGGSMFIRPNQ